MFIPLMINDKNLIQIFDPELASESQPSEWEQISLQKLMYPSRVFLTTETYSRNAERTANYELEDFYIVNCKAKPEFEWDIIPQIYVQRLLAEVGFKYNFKDASGIVVPENAPHVKVAYQDFTGTRTIDAYTGQTLEGTFEVYKGKLYIRGFRIAFPER
jgi:hypothetical protein